MRGRLDRPVCRVAEAAAIWLPPKPGRESLRLGRRKAALMSLSSVDKFAEMRRYSGPAGAPVSKLSAQQDPLGRAGVPLKIGRAQLTAWGAVERILLDEAALQGIPMVDVVSKPKQEAAPHNGPFAPKSRVSPILIEGDDLIDPHPVDKAAKPAVRARAGTYDVITFFGVLADLRFARCQGADAMKWVRGKSQIMVDDIAIDARHLSICGGE